MATPFRTPPTAWPTGERMTWPATLPTFLMKSPRKRSSSASFVTSSSSPASWISSASLRTLSPDHSVSPVFELLRLEAWHLLAVLELGAIDVVHDVLLDEMDARVRWW